LDVASSDFEACFGSAPFEFEKRSDPNRGDSIPARVKTLGGKTKIFAFEMSPAKSKSGA
jgi:hypothetical protein